MIVPPLVVLALTLGGDVMPFRRRRGVRRSVRRRRSFGGRRVSRSRGRRGGAGRLRIGYRM